MDLLLDTSVFIRWDRGDSRIPVAWVETLVDPANSVYLSSASAWEIAIKRKAGKLDFDGSTLDAAEYHGFAWCEITPRDAEAAGDLEWDHRDPFDRMLVAQAAQRSLTLVTTDAQMRRAPGVRLL
jgi:PIN domain nuclease of toxin-antitoxin system